MRLLFKNLRKHMLEGVLREELENLGVCVQGALQVPSGRRDQEAAKVRPLTPHFILFVSRGPKVAKVLSLTELCGFRVSVEMLIVLKRPLLWENSTLRLYSEILRLRTPVCCLW